MSLDTTNIGVAGDDKQTLIDLNVRIGRAESKGNEEAHTWLKGILAPALAFQRADGKTFDGRDAFLDKVVQANPAPRETEVGPIQFFGDRAVVPCIVTVKTDDGDKRYHNLRLFVRYEGNWKLLVWANEPL